MHDNVDSNDSVVTVNNEATGREQENLLSTSDASEHDEDDSLLGRTIVYATNATKTSFTSTSSGHLNALTAHAKAANVSATATAEIAAVSTGTAYTTGANASASASSSVVRVNALNATATVVNTSISATVDVLKVAAGN
ncbi:unnamed protein product [Rotaria magnacalcarata]|uniref:Uncharacterized protein n=2 Tax=Rotaria magnacalcarata TaxID=392030 RepID=A0A816M715_9BILA|nr:unnamed protein product [Rotaria magnacalcarata]